MKNNNLTAAKQAKNDEFYTQLSDIEKELSHYQFKDKVVFCNCDDPRTSNFFQYFYRNFEKLGLKKIISACYKNQNECLFGKNNPEPAVYLEYSGDKNGNKIQNLEDIGVKNFKGDGDFRSDESIELLKQADIVVTNPPFSLFREYVAQLVEYDKKFLIIGNMNAITSKAIFPLIKNNKIWFGASIKSGDREFAVPDDYPLKATGCRIDDNGNKFIRVKGVRWFVNLHYKKRYDDLILCKAYNKAEYPNYDNYNAINVDKVKEIPYDYSEIMGVPINFLDKFNPRQFDIVGMSGSSIENSNGVWLGGSKDCLVNGKAKYKRFFIKNRS